MGRAEIRKIIRETLSEALSENVGPGPGDVRNISDIMSDMSNTKFNSKDFVGDYDPDNGVFLYDDEYDKKLSKEFPDHDFDEEAEGYSKMKNKQNWKHFNKNKRVN